MKTQDGREGTSPGEFIFKPKPPTPYACPLCGVRMDMKMTVCRDCYRLVPDSIRMGIREAKGIHQTTVAYRALNEWVEASKEERNAI